MSSSSSSDISRYQVLRRIPSTIYSEMSVRYHPYLGPPVSINMMAHPRYFHDRVEAYDKFNHHVSTFIGYLRRYEAKREQIRSLGKDMTELEKKMVEIHAKMNEAGKEITSNLSCVEIDDVAVESEDEDEEITIQPAPAASLFRLYDDATLYEKVSFPDGSSELVEYEANMNYRVGTRDTVDGVRSREYKKAVPCGLCDESDQTVHYKCSNRKCVARLCYECMTHMEPVSFTCPFCRAPYELKRDGLGIPFSPVAIPPPRPVTPEF